MKMRRVKIRKYVPISPLNSRKQELSPFNIDGKFHTWSTDYNEFESNAGNYAIGIVELTVPSVKEVLSENIKFID